jgi:hypothetical protein
MINYRTREELAEALAQAEAAREAYIRDREEAAQGLDATEVEISQLTAALERIQKDAGHDYVVGIQWLAGTCPNRGGAAAYHEAPTIAQVAHHVDARNWDAMQIYVEVDRALLADTIRASGGDLQKVLGRSLWTHLWPAAVRVDDQGDVVLHVTSGERVQFGRDDVTPKEF